MPGSEAHFRAGIQLYSTCPPSRGPDGAAYRAHVARVARWSEAAGHSGILIYTDNSLVDPWPVAQLVVQATERLAPLVAVQPVYAHPYWVAKQAASLGYLYRRRVVLNMVAGGFSNDLAALADRTPHDRRYDRLVEYTRIVLDLAAGETVTREGEFYRVTHLRLKPELPPELRPGVFLSGSSAAGLAAARALGATAIQYPEPAETYAPRPAEGELGVRIGVLARPEAAEAWRVARARFPEDRQGQLTHELALKTSDSAWHRQLSRLAEEGEASPYWLVPFKNYKTFCPYLVGGYDTVAAELARYLAAGFRTFLLDIPPDAEELSHTNAAFSRAMECLPG